MKKRKLMELAVELSLEVLDCHSDMVDRGIMFNKYSDKNGNCICVTCRKARKFLKKVY